MFKRDQQICKDVLTEIFWIIIRFFTKPLSKDFEETWHKRITASQKGTWAVSWGSFLMGKLFFKVVRTKIRQKKKKVKDCNKTESVHKTNGWWNSIEINIKWCTGNDEGKFTKLHMQHNVLWVGHSHLGVETWVYDIEFCEKHLLRV